MTTNTLTRHAPPDNPAANRVYQTFTVVVSALAAVAVLHWIMGGHTSLRYVQVVLGLAAVALAAGSLIEGSSRAALGYGVAGVYAYAIMAASALHVSSKPALFAAVAAPAVVWAVWAYWPRRTGR